MRCSWRRRAMAVVVLAVALFPLALDAQSAAALPEGDPLFPFSYTVDAVTHVKKFDQTITVPGGSFVGAIDLYDGALEGSLTLPQTEFTFTLAGVGLVTATAKIVPKQLVTGNGRLQSLAEPAAHRDGGVQHPHHQRPPRDRHRTSIWSAAGARRRAPVTVTMSANANLGGPTTMSGEFTIPTSRTAATS